MARTTSKDHLALIATALVVVSILFVALTSFLYRRRVRQLKFHARRDLRPLFLPTILTTNVATAFLPRRSLTPLQSSFHKSFADIAPVDSVNRAPQTSTAVRKPSSSSS